MPAHTGQQCIQPLTSALARVKSESDTVPVNAENVTVLEHASLRASDSLAALEAAGRINLLG